MTPLDPLCGRCGHVRGMHDGDGPCLVGHRGNLGTIAVCDCPGFVPAGGQARADAEAFLARIAKLPANAVESDWFQLAGVSAQQLHRVCSRLVELEDTQRQAAA